MTTCHTGKHTLLATLVSPAWHETTWPSLHPALPVSVYSALEKDLLDVCRFCLNPTTMEACMCLRSWLRAGIKLMGGQDANVTSSQEPLRGSKSTTEADSIPELPKGADNTEEFDVFFITEEEEWSESV